MTRPGESDDQRPPRPAPEHQAGGGGNAAGGSQGDKASTSDPKQVEAARRKRIFLKSVMPSFNEIYPAYILVDFQLMRNEANQVKLALTVSQRETTSSNNSPKNPTADSDSSRDAGDSSKPPAPSTPTPGAIPRPRFNWTSLTTLVLSTITVVLLLLKKDPVPQVLPNFHDDFNQVTQKFKAEMDKLADAAGKQKTKVEGLDSALNELKRSGVSLPNNFAADIASKVVITDVAKAEEVRRVVQAAVTELKSEVSKTSKTAPPLPEDYWNKLSGEMTKVVANAAPKLVAKPPPERDTYLVITHGSAMDANRLMGSLREVLTKIPFRGPDAPVRVGLAAASTDRIKNLVSPVEPAVNFPPLANANVNDSEEPQMFGGKIKRLFPSEAAGRLDQRSILLVSDRAVAPAVDKPEDMDGWAEMGRVDVVVLASRDPKDFAKLDWDRYSKWCEFVEACHGTVQIIGRHDVQQRQNDLLRDALRRLISQTE